MKTLAEHSRKRGAFTLLELLVVIGIIAALAAIALPVFSSVQKKGAMVKEMSAARQVISAYITAAGDNDGVLLAGYNAKLTAKDERGKPLHNPVSARYPWRLAPYLQYDLGTLYGKVGDQRLRLDRERDYSGWIYSVSVSPAFGINGIFVGGDYAALNPDNPRFQSAYGAFCITRAVNATKASRLLVFASAAYAGDGHLVPGYFKVEAPHLPSRSWPEHYSPDASPDTRGYVDFRHDNKAVVAMLDGHVELLEYEKLRDMRYWSNQAAEADDPEFKLGSQ